MFGTLGYEIRRKIHAPLNHPVLYNSKENTDNFYADAKLVATYENKIRLSFYREMISELSGIINPIEINTIADISAGTGKFLLEFQKRYSNKKFFGFEYSDKALELCRKNCPDIPFEKMNLYEPINKKFDLVLCVDTLEHLEYPAQAITNMFSMLNDNGYLFLVVPNGRYDTFEGHIHYWSPESFKLFLHENNCVIKHTKVWNQYNEQCAVVKHKLN